MPSILIVDNDVSVLRCVAIMFQRAGWSVFCARKIAEAIDIIKDTATLHVIVCDTGMEPESGASLARHIMKHGPFDASLFFHTAGDTSAAADVRALGFQVSEKPQSVLLLATIARNAIRASDGSNQE